MIKLIDIPVVLTSEKTPRSVTLREYIEDAKKTNESRVGFYIHDVLDALFIHLLDIHELTQELAEIRIFEELKGAFGDDVAQEVFTVARENKEYEREFMEALENGTVENFLRRKNALMLKLDDVDPSETLGIIDELLNLSPEDLKKRIGTGIDDLPKNEGTSFN